MCGAVVARVRQTAVPMRCTDRQSYLCSLARALGLSACVCARMCAVVVYSQLRLVPAIWGRSPGFRPTHQLVGRIVCGRVL